MSQGETVAGEVLGSGNPAQAGQSFRLHRAPLTYSRDEDGFRPRAPFSVQVNGAGGRGEGAGERWHEIETLALARPGERVFSVATDGVGRATLRFGDGVCGARLPAGSDNVRANYRFGAGSSGNVAAGSLVALRKRPAGVRSATNPCAATGGADAETIDALRLRAPRALRCCARIVSLADYAAFAQAFPGVLRAEATLLEDVPGMLAVCLTVAADGPVPISAAPRLKAALEEAIDLNRFDMVELRIADPKLVPVQLRLALVLHPKADVQLVEERVASTIALAFSLEAVDSARLDPAELARATPGVVSAELIASEAEGPGLAARAARVDPATGVFEPAYWPVITADTIRIELGQ
jgi:predicted phage baseplate assembly protein